MSASVLFVCTANVCRSPVAQGIFGRAFPEWSVASAGVRAEAGLPMHPLSSAELAGRGAELPGFASSPVTAHGMRRAAAVITMSRAELREALRVDPTALHRTATLGEVRRAAREHGGDLAELVRRVIAGRTAARPAEDIADPLGGPAAVAAAVAAVAAAVDEVVAALGSVRAQR
ncbi:hypothetical protein ACFPM7_05965 [Actinokineospora guangxiensis]|uniref:protein-tyrosine-phosphatase n=1 Tax=Actinokineospora guangxiensis TaxID=1490288 RepID=A0ABW0EK90_9PSEU